ncbi:hypothetical protein B0H13DRAFT_2306432 [Mycena leptocephala]|nr:hypothetical protein B0H13DRAFT_2306432 [Mycena leptocephala]
MRPRRRLFTPMILLPFGVNAIYGSSSLFGPLIVHSPVHEYASDHVLSLCDDNVPPPHPRPQLRTVRSPAHMSISIDADALTIIEAVPVIVWGLVLQPARCKPSSFGFARGWKRTCSSTRSTSWFVHSSFAPITHIRALWRSRLALPTTTRAFRTRRQRRVGFTGLKALRLYPAAAEILPTTLPPSKTIPHALRDNPITRQLAPPTMLPLTFSLQRTHEQNWRLFIMAGAAGGGSCCGYFATETQGVGRGGRASVARIALFIHTETDSLQLCVVFSQLSSAHWASALQTRQGAA